MRQRRRASAHHTLAQARDPLAFVVRRIAYSARISSEIQPDNAPALGLAASDGGWECHAAQARHKVLGRK
jgi:hypothetical protein